jgi:heme A synthase
VRSTDSGLGCPDWPRCHGSFIPKLEKHTLIEYSHRLTASVAGLLVLAVAVSAWRSYRRVPAVLYPALLTVVLLVFQAGLGGAAVVNELPPEIITVHLGTAITILTLLILITTASFAAQRPLAPLRVSRQLGQVALLALGLTFALMLIGSYVSGAGYGLACNGWPLCNGDVIPTADAVSVQLHFMHRLLAGIVGLVLVALAWLGWRGRDEAPLVAALTGAALVIFVLQALLGAANVWTRLADGIGALHLAGATLLWSLLAVLNIRVHRLHDLLPATSRPAVRNDLASVTR